LKILWKKEKAFQKAWRQQLFGGKKNDNGIQRNHSYHLPSVLFRKHFLGRREKVNDKECKELMIDLITSITSHVMHDSGYLFSFALLSLASCLCDIVTSACCDWWRCLHHDAVSISLLDIFFHCESSKLIKWMLKSLLASVSRARRSSNHSSRETSSTHHHAC
jgi:hypothetical protein